MAINPTGSPAGYRILPATLGLLLLLWGLTCSIAAQANLTVSVDRQQISDVDLLLVRVRLENPTSSSVPDFSPLEADFDIVGISGPQQTSRTSMINGVTRSEVYILWEVTLRAKRLGQLTIPSLNAGGDRSAPITVSVSKATAEIQRRNAQYVFFETSVDVEETYVQAQILYTVKLFYTDSVSGDFPPPPAIENAVIESLESEKRYDAIVNNRRYYVLEKRYAIYPQRSGELVIPRETFSGTRGRSSFFAAGERTMAVSDGHTVRIKPRPASFNGDHWLPARTLILAEQWSQSPPEFQVGEPINRTITLTVEGLAGSLLPPLDDLSLNNAKTYADPPAVSQVGTPGGLVSTQTYTIGVVPTTAGILTLPAIRLPWWNTETDSLAYAEIPATSYTVAPAANSAAVASPPVPVPEADVLDSDLPTIAGSGATPQSPLAFGLALVFALLWLATLWLWWQARRRLPEAAQTQVAVAGVDENEDEATRFSVFADACRNNDAPKARHALFLWGQCLYPAIASTHELAQVCGDASLKAEIDRLERSRYAGNQQQPWQGQALLDTVLQLRQQRPAMPHSGDKAKLLAALNPA